MSNQKKFTTSLSMFFLFSGLLSYFKDSIKEINSRPVRDCGTGYVAELESGPCFSFYMPLQSAHFDFSYLDVSIWLSKSDWHHGVKPVFRIKMQYESPNILSYVVADKRYIKYPANFAVKDLKIALNNFLDLLEKLEIPIKVEEKIVGSLSTEELKQLAVFCSDKMNEPGNFMFVHAADVGIEFIEQHINKFS